MAKHSTQAVLLNWYREQLKVLIPPLLEKWQPFLGVQASHWGIKKMKTKWGSCNPTTRRLWFNLELAKKPVLCLEYIVVHELVHLLERYHSERFTALMDGLPHDPAFAFSLVACLLRNVTYRRKMFLTRNPTPCLPTKSPQNLLAISA